MGLVANNPFPAPATLESFISSLYNYESSKKSGSSGSPNSGFIIMDEIICAEIAINNIYMDKIKKIVEDPLELTLAISGLGLLGFYLFYARDHLFEGRKKKSQNSLELGLKDLIKYRNDENICKIVITQSDSNKLPFKGNLVTRLKQLLLSQQQNILVNCSPLKLFDAGSEVFASTLSKQDPEDEHQFFSYFENALKCQLLIERTVTDIEQIKNKTKRSYLICDTNSMDLKVRSEEDLWRKFLQKLQISDAQLRDNYQIVFHVLSADYIVSPKIGARKRSMNKPIRQSLTDDEKIKQAWSGFHNYYPIRYEPDLTMEENVEASLEVMLQRLKQFLPETVRYQKPAEKSME